MFGKDNYSKAKKAFLSYYPLSLGALSCANVPSWNRDPEKEVAQTVPDLIHPFLFNVLSLRLHFFRCLESSLLRLICPLANSESSGTINKP